MPFNNSGLFHFHLRKRIHQKKEKFPSTNKLKKLFDIIISIVVIVGPLSNIPQLLEIWIQKNASGVSLLSWLGFLIVAMVWLIYGIIHKEKPIIIMNIGLILTELLIVIGILLYR
jgi:MtN3 and saliva related transmembrane protein